MGYTKGEWKARHPINNDITIYIGEYGEGITQIAQIFESSLNAKANAQLIAAAPDIYEALKELMVALENWETGRESTERDIRIAYNLAKPALAKAGGK